MREDGRLSLWKSLKRALGGAPIDRPAEIPAPVPSPEPVSGVPPAAPVQAIQDVNDVPPFLAEEPPRPADAAPSAPQEPARLARGLASFSRRNPEREKKFAHLLHDNPPDEKEGSPPHGHRG